MGKKERLLEYFKRLTQTEKDAVVGRAAELCRDKAVAIYLPLNKMEFLESEFGSRMVSVIVEWDQALVDADRETNPEVQKKLAQCLAQWEICQMVMRQFYGIEYHFTRTDEYFGICTEDGSDWLVKVDREPCLKYKEAMMRTRNLKRIVNLYNESVPVQPKESPIKLVLEQAYEIGRVTL